MENSKNIISSVFGIFNFRPQTFLIHTKNIYTEKLPTKVVAFTKLIKEIRNKL